VRVIFLDIDGVLNHPGRYGDGSWKQEPKDGPLRVPVEPACMTRLNRLITETSAGVVISSSWRLFARFEDLGPALQRYGLVGDVIGETPDLVNDPVWLEAWRTRDGAPFTYEHMERGWEIREWLAAHPEVTEFAILDDCSDMAELRPWLVLTDAVTGLDDPDVERAKWIMQRSPEALPLVRSLAIGYARRTP
jgi:hypothetical protein